MTPDELFRPEYYRRLQEAYLAKRPSVWKRIEIIERYLDPGPEDVILETGTGQGTIAYELALRCRRVYAVDKNDESMWAAQHFLQGVRGRENLVLLQADMEALPFSRESFTKINFSEVVEHLERPAVVLRDLHRVLCKGGRMAVTTWPNKAHVVWNWRYRHGRGSVEDFNPQTPRSLSGLLRDSGFEILDVRLTNFYMHLARTRWEIDGCSQENVVARLCERLFTVRPWGDYLATSINMLCRKR